MLLLIGDAMESKDLLAKGIESAKAGDRQEARDLIARVVKADLDYPSKHRDTDTYV